MRMMLGVATAVAMAGLSAGASAANDYPSEPIRMVVPFAPGGSVNILARLFGDAMAATWGQPVIVDPKPGAGGVVASETLAKAEPDGYTLMMATANVAINATLYNNLSFDTETDLTRSPRSSPCPVSSWCAATCR